MKKLYLAEICKIKRMKMTYVAYIGILFSMIVSSVQLLGRTQDLTFEQLANMSIYNNVLLVLPFCLSLIGGYIIDREYAQNTQKNLLTIQSLCGLLQVVELRPLLIARRLLNLDVVFQINPQGNSLALFGRSCDNAALDTFFDCFLGVGFPQCFAAGKAFLSGGAERNKFAGLDFIPLGLHEQQKIVKVFGLGNGRINGGFQLRFPARPFPLGVPLGVALALALAGLHHGQSVFLTKPVAGAPDISITLFVGNVLALIDHIHGTKNDVIMDVALVYVGCQHIGV